MLDEQIIELYWNRDEQAIAQTSLKYGRYCHQIAWNVLRSLQDSEECVNDTWLRTWNAIPPQKPACLRAFLGRITRNLSLNRYKEKHAEKRGGGQISAALDELADCLPALDTTENAAETQELSELIDRFLQNLGRESRIIFVQRYWYLRSVREIAADRRMKESAVKMSLLRTRERLRTELEKEGFR